MGRLEGFVDYNVDAVIKFGGSLLQDVQLCGQAVRGLAELSRKGKRVVVLPGGGPTDNTIEAIDKSVHFHPDTHHRACALAQDQTGIMIADPAFSDALTSVDNVADALRCLRAGKVPVLLPSSIIFAVDPFERSWDITSDSMAAWFAWLLNANLVVVLTDVDGIYRNGDIDNPDSLIGEIAAASLADLGCGAVDACFAAFTARKGIDAWVLHGRYPERLRAVFEGRTPTGTFVRGCIK